MKQQVHTNGYLVVDINRRPHKAHRFVLECFEGLGDGLDSRHLNGVRTDNRVENLVWGTRAQNMADARGHGTAVMPPKHLGEAHPAHKLTEDDVRAIRADPRRQVDIAADYGIDQTSVSHIKRRKTWQHVG